MPMLLLDAAGAALPPSAPWWGTIILASVAIVPGVVAVVLEVLRRRREGEHASAKDVAALREEVAKARAENEKLAARVLELEDDGTDPEVRAGCQRRVDERLNDLEEWRKRADRRAEESAKLDAELQRALGRVEGSMGRVEGAIARHADRNR